MGPRRNTKSQLAGAENDQDSQARLIAKNVAFSAPHMLGLMRMSWDGGRWRYRGSFYALSTLAAGFMRLRLSSVALSKLSSNECPPVFRPSPCCFAAVVTAAECCP